MAQLSFDTTKSLLSTIPRLWDFRIGGSAGYTWGAINYPRGIEFLDLNGDGLKDLVLAPNYYNYDPACPLIYSFNEGGQFKTFQTISPPLNSAFASNGMYQLTWKGESYLLIIDQGLETGGVGNYPGSKNWLYRYDAATKTLVDATYLLPDNNQSMNHVARIGDINNDGNPDVLFSRLWTNNCHTEGAVWWSFEDTVKNRSAELPIQIAESEKRSTINSASSIQQTLGSISYADFDGNGISDIISLGYDSDITNYKYSSPTSVRIYLNSESKPLVITSDFIKNSHYFPNDPTSRTMSAMDCATGDIDHDGDTDLIVMWEGAGPSYLQVLRNDGNRKFSDVTEKWLGDSAYRDTSQKGSDGFDPAAISRIQLKDIDTDGYLDLYLRTYMVAGSGLTSGSDDQAFLLRNGNGTGFSPYDFSGLKSGLESLYSTTELRSWNIGFPSLADLNGDGVLDLTFVKGAETFIDHEGQKYSEFYQVVTIPGTGDADTVAPSIDLTSLAISKNRVPITANVVVAFNEPIRLGSGKILLTTPSSEVAESWTANDNQAVTLYDKTLSINPTANLKMATQYTLQFESGAILDLAGNNFPQADTFTFTTAPPPTTPQTLKGTTSNDTLVGGTASDKLTGSDGSDWLDGGVGADKMDGGSGNDTFVVDNAKDAVKENASAGDDLILSSVSYVLPANVETLTLTGTDAINATGSKGNDILNGNSGANRLDGGASGADTLSGGQGIDVFVFKSKPSSSLVGISYDKILDFAPGTDSIELSAKQFKLPKGVTSFTAANFVTGLNASDANDCVLYDSTTGFLSYDPDGSGIQKAIQIALLGISSHPNLTANDVRFA